jgi:rod shape-determining protein MreC
LIVVGLVLLSLMLLTISFRESSNGPLHRLQGYGSQVTRPFQVVADRIARPFEDASGWMHDMAKAKKKNKELRAELKQAQQKLAQRKNAEADALRLASLLRFERSPRFPQDYDAVNAEVMTRASGPFEQTIVIAGGENREIRVNDPVINEDGLVGRISQVGPTTSNVTLLSDPSFAVSARDLESTTDAQGIVLHPATGSDVLMLDGVTVGQTVKEGDPIVTSGWRRQDLNSLYPRGISIGRITSYNQSDVNPDKQIQVEPSVDFSSLDAVIVLLPKTRGVNNP